MIKAANLVKEITVAVENKIGVLANISRILADHDINIEGVAGYAMDGKANIMVVCDDTLRAGDALKKAGYKGLKESEVIVVDLENKAGALKVLTEKLAAAGIDIRYTYGTACVEACPSRIVVSTNNNEKAFVLLKK